MTTVGHSLMGLCFGALAIPRRWSAPKRAQAFASFALIANLPDVLRPLASENAQRVSHSLFVTLALIGAAALLLAASPGTRSKLGGWWVAGAGAAAWLSHLVLDSFYSHGRGIHIFWPVLPITSLRLPIPWFDVMPRDGPPDLVTLQIVAIEVACYGALLALCLAARLRWKSS